MSEVIVLSDSNESNLSIELNDELNHVNENKKQKILIDDTDSNDFEFPAVQFYHTVNENRTSALCDNNGKDYLNDFNSWIPSYQSNNKLPTTSKSTKEHNVKTHRISDSPDASEDSENDNNTGKKKNSKATTKKNKRQITEKGVKKQKQLKETALKAIALKRSKNIKPGECLKFIEVVIDKNIEKYAYITNIVNTLLDANIKYSIDTGLTLNGILWKRSVENSYVNESNEICTTTDIETVNQILIIWNWNEVVTKVADDSFCDSIVNIKASLADYKIILVIFGIENYFTYRKQGKNSNKNKTKRNNTSNNDELKNSPEISRHKLEMCLDEVQIIANCNSRLIDSPQDLALMIYQCTKAVAEIPYKLEKSSNLRNKFDWYVMGDNRNTVRVDKDGNGLKRVWQQQLCQFNLSSLEIAEAICSVYPSPADLIEAYMNCTDDNGLNLLKDIPIRRAAGPLTTIRKIGPELSKKIYLMFTSEDGENILC